MLVPTPTNLVSMPQLRLNDQLRSILRNIRLQDRIYDQAESSTVSDAIRPLSSAGGILCTNNLIVASIGRSWCKSLQLCLKSPILHGSIVQADQHSPKAVGRDNQVRVIKPRTGNSFNIDPPTSFLPCSNIPKNLHKKQPLSRPGLSTLLPPVIGSFYR